MRYQEFNESSDEFKKEVRAKKAYRRGQDDATSYRPKAVPSDMADFARDYSMGYDNGKDMNAHNDWREKQAAKRAGADYHETYESDGDDEEFQRGWDDGKESKIDWPVEVPPDMPRWDDDSEEAYGDDDEDLMASRGQLPRAQARIRRHKLR